MTHDQAVALAVIGILGVAYALREWIVRGAVMAIAGAVWVAAIAQAVGWWKVAAVASLPALWVLWVLILPYTDCWVCKGKGQYRFLWSIRDCARCDGGRRKQRFTARLIRRGRPRRDGTILAPRTDRNR